MVRGVHRDFRRRRSVGIKVHTCKHFSGFRFGTSYKSGIEEAQYLYFAKDRNSEICKRTKITKAPCRNLTGEGVPRAENFGDLITADHEVLNEGCEPRDNHRYATVIQDLTTQPCKTKTSEETEKSSRKILQPSEKTKVIYIDNFIGISQIL